MSKISQRNKEAKLKGKQKKIADAEAKKTEKATPAKQSKIPNLNKCCTCAHYPAHFHHTAQPCKIKGTYVARKCDACESYKCKYQ